MTITTTNIDSAASADAMRPRVLKAAAEFEAVLLNTVFGELESSFSKLPGSKVEHATEAYSGLGMQALTSGLAQSGGIGLSRMITHALVNTEVRTKVSGAEKQDY
jgi:Rod binding domain-containing protein